MVQRTVWRYPKDAVCSIDGCPREVKARGWCSMHYWRWWSNHDPGPAGRRRGARGTRYVRTSDGYRIVKDAGGKPRPEHRLIMEAMLGRPLLPEETVHHKNGQRADNRPANLELWLGRQPKGQRVEDLIAFVCQHYPEQVAQALDR